MSNRQQSLGSTLNYNAASWNGALGYTRSSLRNASANDSNGHTKAWTLALGKQWQQDQDWSLGLNFNGNHQQQQMDNSKNLRSHIL
ncbi:MAG: hypothetical protein KUL75_00900 [Sterolibacterium sp.]|nr:hypothetical protein [Sterolibacterium sp.]